MEDSAIIGEHLIDAGDLAAGPPGDTRPLAFVDLAATPEDSPAPWPQPMPLIGLGDASHPYARHCDALIEPPVSPASIVAQVAKAPAAAAVAMQFLRASETLEPMRALTLESLAYAVCQAGGEHGAWIAARGSAPADPAPPGRVDVRREGDVLHVALNRPDALNAIDRPMRDALFEAFTLAAIDSDIARIEWRGLGRAFSMGADLDEFGTTRDPARAHAIRMRTLPALPLIRCGDRVAAFVQGGCVGSGLEMAAFAGRIVAAPSAWFQLPELGAGIMPGAGGCVSVPRRIGRQRAALMILSGRRIDARTALDWGLVDAIEELPSVDPDRADAD